MKLGHTVRRYRERVVNGRMFEGGSKANSGARWCVVTFVLAGATTPRGPRPSLPCIAKGSSEEDTMAEKAIVHRSGEGKAFWMLGGLYEVLLSSDETNGAATIMQMTLPTGRGPPMHVHRDVTETVYVVDGTVTYYSDGDKIEGGPGTLFRIPANTSERIEPKSDARIVVTYEPGGMDKFFAEAGEPAQRREPPPAPTSPPDVERMAKIGARYGLELQPPPGG
jgi:quercetin dioxygenase-like cupin family protein